MPPVCYILPRSSLFVGTSQFLAVRDESFQLNSIALSDPGKIRALNEDAFAIDDHHAFALVADGMGGHNAGEVASRIAADFLKERLADKIRQSRKGASQTKPAQFAEQLVSEANRAIHTAAKSQADYAGMGTTLALLMLTGNSVALLHVGDSRIYRLRNGRIEQLTRDDSLLADQIELGLVNPTEADLSHNRHFVTGALGQDLHPKIHVKELPAEEGDIFLLSTDGLTDMVDDSDIELIVDKLKTNMKLAAEHLIQLANDQGGSDNITVALVRVSKQAEDSGGFLPKLLGWLKR